MMLPVCGQPSGVKVSGPQGILVIILNTTSSSCLFSERPLNLKNYHRITEFIVVVPLVLAEHDIRDFEKQHIREKGTTKGVFL